MFSDHNRIEINKRKKNLGNPQILRNPTMHFWITHGLVKKLQGKLENILKWIRGKVSHW